MKYNKQQYLSCGKGGHMYKWLKHGVKIHGDVHQWLLAMVMKQNLHIQGQQTSEYRCKEVVSVEGLDLYVVCWHSRATGWPLLRNRMLD